MKKLRIAVLLDKRLMPAETTEGLTEREIAPWKTEYDVVETLKEMGHDAKPVGIGSDLEPLASLCEQERPDVAFNLLEEVGGLRIYMPYLLGYLEVTGVPYTGCNPRGLIMAHSKPVVNRLLRAHRIRMPDFVLCERNRRIRRPARLGFPLVVKSATEHGSTGIAQASVVHDDDQLKQRVEFIHEHLQTDAIVEQFVEGREIYVGVIGNRRLQTFPIWELTFRNLPEDAANIATAKVKWDPSYQEKTGVRTGKAKGLSPALERQILRTSKRVYRILVQSGYARIDYRLSPEGELYVLECNPNPQLAYGEDFAESAETSGVGYEQLLQRILNLGIRYAAQTRD